MENISNRINAAHKQEIDIIIKRMKDCPKGFECLTINSDALCKVKDLGDNAFIQCIEFWSDCKFRGKSFGGLIVCRCPLRHYLHHKFEVWCGQNNLMDFNLLQSSLSAIARGKASKRSVGIPGIPCEHHRERWLRQAPFIRGKDGIRRPLPGWGLQGGCPYIPVPGSGIS